ncbi:MAG: lysylphosphatidylglycerol synthase domain-containing protein [Bacteroidales bacterium]|nr:lysylphosphatidylglycerol synthase domain-containing protein [Bacteroidales bacterium]MCF8387734.1 lysylphosphatidylglycerol synthase domain-containing protein [Bacteroidales bacterium]MCF8397550.1 lysylphosphatidylglycerol synthase domain-containing protein [Bacteroidales bacterium]
MKANLKKTYNYLIRAFIILATWFFLYRQIFVKRSLEDVYNIFLEQFRTPLFLWGVVLVFLLMFVNWAIETIKWRYLIRKIEKVKFLSAYEAVFTGISVSAFLPNRVGDYFGRVFILEKANHLEGILITIIGSISQFISTILVGSIALVFFFPLFTDTSDYFYGYLYPAVLAMLIVANFLVLLFYFNISILSKFLKKFTRKEWKKFRDHLKAFSYFNQRELLKILMLSILRYLVFCFQFFLLLQLFQVYVPYYYSMVLIPVIYLAITAIPTIALTEIGVRGSVSIYIIGLYFSMISTESLNTDIGIFSASSMLWLINIVIPALIGTFFVFRLKFFRKHINGHGN